VSGGEFVRKVENLGRKERIPVEFIPRRGKGSHGTLVFGTRHAIVGNLKKELKKGTLHGILKQLGIKPDDL
jgi:mRNA interferase HicA